MQEIQQAIVNLAPHEKERLWGWMRSGAETDWKAWDRQIEEDSTEGRLDALIAKVDKDFDEGKCSEWS